MKKKSTLIILLVAVFVLLAVLLGLGLFAKSPQDRFQRQLSLGDRYYAEMDYDRAITAYTEALEIDPKNVEVKIALGDTYQARGLQYLEESEQVPEQPAENLEADSETEALCEAYREVLAQLQEEYGEQRIFTGHQDMYTKRLEGVFYADLVDLTGDGVPELFVVCKSDLGGNHIGYVYTMADGKAECILKDGGYLTLSTYDWGTLETVQLVRSENYGYMIMHGYLFYDTPFSAPGKSKTTRSAGEGWLTINYYSTGAKSLNGHTSLDVENFLKLSIAF